MSRELDQAKNAYERALSALAHAMLAQPYHAEVANHLKPEAWSELYYAHPAAVYASRRLPKLWNDLAGVLPEVAQPLLPLVEACVTAAGQVVLYKGLPVRRVRARRPGSPWNVYKFSHVCEPIPAGHRIAPGDYLCLRYGNGMQLAYVAGETGRVGLQIRRLENRGHAFAGWSESWISRDDSRILGLSRPCPQDPKMF